MIVWLKKEAVNAASHVPYGCDQRARILTAEQCEKHGLRLVVEMCGTGEYLGISPEHVIGVELTPGVTIRFKNPPIICTSTTNGVVDS